MQYNNNINNNKNNNDDNNNDNNNTNKDLVRQGILASGKGMSTGFALVNERHTRRDNILKYII